MRAQASIALVIGLIILPVLIVRAQSEGDVVQPPAADDSTIIEETESEVPVPEEESAPVVETPAEEAAPAEGEGASGEVLAQEGEVLGESDAAEQPSAPTEPATTTPQTEALVDSGASSTPQVGLSVDGEATSTAPVEEPKPIEEPYVLQPAVTLDINGSSITADIELENLTCKACEKVLPVGQVRAYYTAWYPNDGPDLKEVGEHYAEQEINVSDVALWASRSMS